MTPLPPSQVQVIATDTQRDALGLTHCEYLWRSSENAGITPATDSHLLVRDSEVVLWSGYVDQVWISKRRRQEEEDGESVTELDATENTFSESTFGGISHRSNAAADSAFAGDEDDGDDEDVNEQGGGGNAKKMHVVKRTRAMAITNQSIRLLTVDGPYQIAVHIPHDRLWYVLYEKTRSNEGMVAILEKGGLVSAMVNLYSKFWFFDLLIKAYQMWQESNAKPKEQQQRVPFMRVTRVGRYVELLGKGNAAAGQQAALKFLMQQQLKNNGNAADGKGKKRRNAFTQEKSVLNLPTQYADMFVGDECHNNPWVLSIPEKHVRHLYRTPVVEHGGIMNWLIRYNDIHIVFSENICKRTAKGGTRAGSSVDKWLIVTDRALYICNSDTGEMGRRVLLSNIATLIVEQVLTAKLSMIFRKGNMDDRTRNGTPAPKSRRAMAIIVPSEYDLLIESHHVDALIGVIRSQHPQVSLEYDFHPHRKCKLTVTKAYKDKLRKLQDPAYLREMIRVAVADRDEDRLSYILECCSSIGMDGGGDAMFTLGQQQLVICRDFRIMKETMVTALHSWDLLTLADMMQKLVADLQNEKQRQKEDHEYVDSDYRGTQALEDLFTELKPQWEEIIKVFKWLRKGARKGSKGSTAKLDPVLIQSCVRRFTDLSSRCGDVQTLTRLMALVEDEELHSTVEDALVETEGMQQQSINSRVSPDNGHVLRIAFKKSCEEFIDQCARKLGLSKRANAMLTSSAQRVLRGMVIHVDVFDKLGYHHSTSLDFPCEKAGSDDDEGDELVALIDLETCMRKSASQVKSHQIHFVFSAEVSGHQKGRERRERSILVELIKTASDDKGRSATNSSSLNFMRPEVVHEWMWAGLESDVVNENTQVTDVKQQQQSEVVVAFEPHPHHQRPTKEKRRVLLCVVSKILQHVEDVQDDASLDALGSSIGISSGKKKSRARSLFSRRRKKTELTKLSGMNKNTRRAEVHWNMLSVGKTIDAHVVEGGFGLSSTSVTLLRNILGILPPPRAVIINILSARGLSPRDRWSGKADPFVKVHYHGREYKTKYKHVTLNPVWKNEECRFEIPRDEHAGSLLVECWDHDHFGAGDFMGQCRIEMGDVERTEDWYDLGPQENETQPQPDIVPCSGQVRLRIVFEFDDE